MTSLNQMTSLLQLDAGPSSGIFSCLGFDRCRIPNINDRGLQSSWQTNYSSAGQVHTYFARYYLTVVEPIGLDEMLLHDCDYHDS